MSHEQQYIEIFEQNSALIEKHSAPLLNSCRQQAIERFAQAGLPGNKDEAWRHTDIAKRFAAD